MPHARILATRQLRTTAELPKSNQGGFIAYIEVRPLKKNSDEKNRVITSIEYYKVLPDLSLVATCSY